MTALAPDQAFVIHGKLMDRGIQVVAGERCDLVDVIGIFMQKILCMDLPVFICDKVRAKAGNIRDLKLCHQFFFQRLTFFGKARFKRGQFFFLVCDKLFSALFCYIAKVFKRDLLFFKQILLYLFLLGAKLLHSLGNLPCLLRLLIGRREDPEGDPGKRFIRIGVHLIKIELCLFVLHCQVI